MRSFVEELRKTLPPVFAGTSVDELTGSAIRWRSVQNKKSLGEIPIECFARSGSKLLIIRDPFLNWWTTTLAEAHQPVARSPSQPDQAA
jgi:hypothetical protein